MRSKVDWYRIGVTLVALAGIAFAVVLFAPSAYGHTDGGEDEAWNETMNQASYWEERFTKDGLEVSCIKFNNHGGGIPAGYEAVVVKGGDDVRVYGPNLDGLGAFTASGPAFETGPPHNRKHQHRDISWVTKCNIDVVPQPDPLVEESEWEDGEFVCDDTTVEQTRTVTTTPYIWEDGQWVLDAENATTETQTQTRELTEDEQFTCPTTPTTPTTEATTTTTTTLPPTTTSVPATTTSTAPTELVETGWNASGTCNSMTTFDWGEGIIAVEVFSMTYEGEPQTDEESSTFTFDGQTFTHKVASAHLFTLIPVVEPGFVAVPAQIELIADQCTPVPSVTTPEAPETPSTPDLEELPYTGLGLPVLAILGLVLAATGGLIVRKVSA